MVVAVGGGGRGRRTLVGAVPPLGDLIPYREQEGRGLALLVRSLSPKHCYTLESALKPPPPTRV